MCVEDLFDGDAEDLGHLGQDIGAGRFIALLPEGDVLLGLADEAAELGLAEASLAPKLGEVSALSRARLGELASHAPSVGAGFGSPVDRRHSGLHDNKYTCSTVTVKQAMRFLCFSLDDFSQGGR